MTTDPTDEEFRNMVRAFWEKKEDPTAYMDWDAERCQRLMPMFYEAWVGFKAAQEAAWAAIAAET